MRKLLFTLTTTLVLSGSMALSQTIIPAEDELILPQIAINGTTAGSRLQYLCRLRLTGLNAGATYRYFTGASTAGNIATSLAPGNYFGINNSADSYGNIVGYSTNKAMAGVLLGSDESAGTARYSELTADAGGEYTGWFSFVPTGNAVFNGGNNVYIYVQLNDGNGGTSIAQSYRTSNTVTMRTPGSSAGNSTQASAIRGSSSAAPENIILLYDNISGSGRPVYGSWAESDGITTTFTSWYNSTGGVDGTAGAWGAYIPNDLTNGIRRIEERSVTAATLLNADTDSDGIWPSGVNTVNPGGGTTAIVLSSNDAPLPVEFSSFSVFSSEGSAFLRWSTSSEINNAGFEIYRSAKADGEFVKIASYFSNPALAGVGSSPYGKDYSYDDRDPALRAGEEVFYKLADINFDGKRTGHPVKSVRIAANGTGPRETVAIAVSPNPSSGNAEIRFSLDSTDKLSIHIGDYTGRKVMDICCGKEFPAGEHRIGLSLDPLPEGTYMLHFSGSSSGAVRKLLLTR